MKDFGKEYKAGLFVMMFFAFFMILGFVGCYIINEQKARLEYQYGTCQTEDE